MPDLGRYEAEQTATGTFTVRAVEVFAQVLPGTRDGLPDGLDAKWITAAVDKAKERHAGGYLYPVHVGHTSKTGKPEFAGNLRITHAAEFEYDGEKLLTVYGDLEDVPAHIFERMQRNALPHRSVEILTLDPPEFRSLALLDVETSHFRFPGLTVRLGCTPDALARVTYRANSPKSPLRALTASGSCAALLFEFQPPAKKGGEEKGGKGGEGGDEKGGDEKSEQVDEPVGDAALSQDVCARLDDISGKLEKLLVLLGAPDANRPGAQPNTGMEPVDANKAEDAKDAADRDRGRKDKDEKEYAADTETHQEGTVPNENTDAIKDPKAVAEFAELRAEILALKAKEDSRTKADTVATRVAAAKEALKGFNIGDADKDLAHFAALGQDDLDKFVAVLKKHCVPDGAKTLAEFEQKHIAPKDPDAVMQFSAKGEKAIEAARDVAKEHAQFAARGIRVLPLDRYLKSHPRMQEFAA